MSLGVVTCKDGVRSGRNMVVAGDFVATGDMAAPEGKRTRLFIWVNYYKVNM